MIEHRHMAFGEVNNVDIIAAASPVFGRIIITVDAKLLALAARNLHNNRYKVVWDSIWGLAEETGWVSADRIEIAKECNFKVWSAVQTSLSISSIKYLVRP